MYAHRHRSFRKFPAASRWVAGLGLGCLFASLLLLSGTPNTYGQVTINATLGGTILDSSKAVIPGAKLTLSEKVKGYTRSQNSQPNGSYVFNLIPAGSYELQVEKDGFRTYVQSGINLAVGQSAKR